MNHDNICSVATDINTEVAVWGSGCHALLPRKYFFV
jgi:hypothetical protein